MVTTVRHIYDAWGNVLSSTGSTVNPFQFIGASGYYFDSEKGSNYVRARVYQPTIARWTSQDPLGFVDGLNLYLYVANNPINNVDPSGMVNHKTGCKAATFVTPAKNGVGTCQRVATTHGKWELTTGLATEVNAAIAKPGNIELKKVTEITCVFKRESHMCWACSPCCFAPPKKPPKNKSYKKTWQQGTAEINLIGAKHLVFALEATASFAPDWYDAIRIIWPLICGEDCPNLPDLSITYHKDEKNANLKDICSREGVKKPSDIGPETLPASY